MRGTSRASDFFRKIIRKTAKLTRSVTRMNAPSAAMINPCGVLSLAVSVPRSSFIPFPPQAHYRRALGFPRAGVLGLEAWKGFLGFDPAVLRVLTVFWDVFPAASGA